MTAETETKYDWRHARPDGTNGDWERVIDTDYPVCMETGNPLGPDDAFKLEHSGWKMHVEFKPIEGSHQ